VSLSLEFKTPFIVNWLFPLCNCRMALGSDKETGKSPFVTAQRLNCGPKSFFSFILFNIYLLSEITSVVGAGHYWAVAGGQRTRIWCLCGSTYTDRGMQRWLDDPVQSWHANLDLSLHSEVSDAGTHPFWKVRRSWRFTWGKAYFLIHPTEWLQVKSLN